jgi:BirA family biotin operon repressor/biotin-[acetyl-CoA-carboxylase] ligase
MVGQALLTARVSRSFPLPAPNAFNLRRLREGVKPFRLHFFPRLRSTNDHAAVLRKRGDLFAPAVVLAARQTAGRGRGANTWYSAPAGSITVTFVLPVNATLAPHHLPLAAGLAVRNAAAEISRNDQIQLKWPNDLVYQSAIGNPQSPIRKLAGLLCERLDNVDLIGIGLNVNRPPPPLPKNLRDRIIYLQQLQPKPTPPFDLTTVLITLARHLHTTLIRRSETPFPALLREYDAHHALIGRRVTVISPNEAPVSGKCFGLDDTGRLLLRNRARVHRIIAGHVELTR